MDAFPAMRILAVVQQQRGRRKASATLHARVLPALLLGLAAWGQVGRDVSYLRWVINPGLHSMVQLANQ